MTKWASLETWWQDAGEAELRLILWAAWEPIGPVPRDEYDWYLPRLWLLLQQHASLLSQFARSVEMEAAEDEIDELAERIRASEAKIADQLSEWRIERMCVPANPEQDRAVAQKLTDWLSPPGADEFQPVNLLGAY
jgi:hypothetical protein